MSISQISVFVESKPGHLGNVLEGFESANLSVRGFSAADTGGYGIVRFVVDKPEEALAHLRERGFAVRLTKVLCVKLHDKPGELASVLRVMAQAQVNVVYCYSLVSTYIVLAVNDIARAEKALADTSLELIDDDEIAALPVRQAL